MKNSLELSNIEIDSSCLRIIGYLDREINILATLNNHWTTSFMR